MSLSFTRGSLAPLLWAAILVAAAAVTAMHIGGGAWLRSNVFELLPESHYEPLKETATRVVDAEFGTRLLFFIGHTDRDLAMSVADAFAAELQRIRFIQSVATRVDEAQFSALVDFYYPHRTQILSAMQRTRLVDDAAGIEQGALAQVFSPFGTGGSTLTTDPFYLFADSLQALRPAGNSLVLNDGYLWAEKDGLNYVFLMANLASSTLSIADQEALAQAMNGALAKLADDAPGLDVLKTGFSFYAHEATQSAKGEVSTIGVGSLIGLLLLVVLTFRSLRPLSLIVVSILAGCLVALAVTLSVFGFVHLFTLVFGASLIGVSVDYSFHYIADDAFGGDGWTSSRGLRNIFMGITLGLLTSILAYLALTVAPFPGLQQLAVFSSAGLIAAYFTLLCMARLWRRRFTLYRASLILAAARGVLRVWRESRRHHRYILLALLVFLIAISWRSVEIDDDVRSLQSQPADLVRQEAVIQQLLGIAQAGTFLLSSAPAEEALLRQEEAVRVELDRMIAAGTLDSYQAVSQWVPSRSRQAESHAAYAGFVRAHLPEFFTTLGVETAATENTIANLGSAPPELEISAWLGHPVSEQFRRLWIEAPDGSKASIILLFGVRDLDALTAAVARYPNVAIVNKGRELSALFGEYRARVVQVLLAAYLIILLGLATRYGLRRAAVLLVPPVLAGLLALALISHSGEALNLFNFLAMILVLGIGIDFTLFIAEASHDLTSTMFAITLSAITTMLSFGLLSLSSTFAVHSFGLTVLLGIACAYLLSPLAISARTPPEPE
jgi:predicted exporter